MGLKFHKEIDRYTEGLFAVHTLFAGEPPHTLCEQSAAKRPARAGEIRALYAPLLAVQEDLARAINPEDEQLQLLFSARGAFDEALYTLFLTDDPNRAITDARVLETFGAYFAQLDEAAVIPADEAALLARIRARPSSIADQSALLYVYHNFRTLFAVVRAAAEAAAAVLDAHRAALKPLLDAATAFWTARLTTSDDLRRTFAELQVPLSFDEVSFTLYPTFFRPSGLSVLKYGDGLRLYWGVLLHDLFRFAQEDGFTPVRVQETLKALSDKTKLEIMGLLRTERLYGSQLAERLGLTAATISHHLSQLASLDLIQLVKEGGRFYCEPNCAALAAFLAALKSSLPQ